jgi:hypothetical protein
MADKPFDPNNPFPDPTPTPLNQNPIQSLGMKVKQEYNKALGKQSAVNRTITDFIALPVEGINAALGAPQRVQASRIANLARNPRGVLETTLPLDPLALLDPAGRRQLGNEVYNVFYPNDMSTENAAEHATGVDRLLSKDPRFRGKLQNFAVRTGFQTLTDPLTYATAGTKAGADVLMKALTDIQRGALISENPIARGIAHAVSTNAKMKSEMVATKTGLAPKYSDADVRTFNVLNNKHIVGERIAATNDAKLIEQHAQALRAGVLPEPIRQRLLQSVPDASTRYRNHLAGFEDQPSGSLLDWVENRLAQARQTAGRQALAGDLQKHLGITKKEANQLIEPDALDRAGQHPLFKTLKGVSNAQVDATLAAGIPHGRNIAVLGYNAMGEIGLARAGQFFVKAGADAKYQALVQRLEGGGATHFALSKPSKYSPVSWIPGGNALRKVTTPALDRWDQSVRAARLEQLDKELKRLPGETPEQFETRKLDRVNQDIGAYNMKPPYVKGFQMVGGNFPQWHTYVVPTAVGRAVLRTPGRVQRLARYEQNANDELNPEGRSRITLGGPNTEFASAMADPARVYERKYPSYFGSQSALGPLNALVHPVGALSETAAGFFPFGNTIYNAVANPYKSPLNWAARSGMSLLGPYDQKRTPGAMRRIQSQWGTPATPAPTKTDKPFDPNHPFE